ncbi:MAG: PEP/pyruvate-binding domain-containing protein [Gemmatimonadota bacterium]
MTASVLTRRQHAPGRARLLASLDTSLDVTLVGGKAHTLGRLMRRGVRVPEGFVLRCEALERHLEHAGIAGDIRSRCAGRDFIRAEDRAQASAEIRRLVCGASLPDDVQEALLAHARPLLERGSVVVRSSAVGEDSAAASFAGQLDSILHVTDDESLQCAVLACWASFWSERALFYRSARGIQPGGMGVIVQEQVHAHAAGVMFTDGGDGALLVEYAAGLGDALVAGAVDPARIRIDRKTGAVTSSGEQIPAADIVVLSTKGIASLIDAARRIERELGSKQDVEWVMNSANELFVVQSRPITASLAAPPAQCDTAPVVVWSNANVNENFPAPISPLLYSVASTGYTHYFRNLGRALGVSPRRLRAMEPAFAQIIGVHAGRMYYNLTNIHAVIRLAPFGDALASSFDTFVGARGQDSGQHAPSRDGRFRRLVEICVVAARSTWNYLTIERRIRSFERDVDEFAARSHPAQLGTLDLAGLRQLLSDFMSIRCHRWTDASLADLAAMVCYGLLQRLIARAYPDGVGVAHTSLLKAIPRVVSNEPVHRLWELSRFIRANPPLADLVEHEEPAAVLRTITVDARFTDFRIAFDRYLEEWGFRCSSELMLTTPSFQEQPAPVIAMLRAYAKLDAESPLEAMARQSAEREVETMRAMATLAAQRIRVIPWMTWASVLRVLLPWTHAAIRYRERARLKQALLYSRLRGVALGIGDHLVRRDLLATRDDVFWFTMAELQELAAGGAMFPHEARALAALRSQAHAAFADASPPDSFILSDGGYLAAGGVAASDAVVHDHAEGESTLRGTTACAGNVTGRAAVLRDVAEAERLVAGDILVTRQTDPGWGPVFFLISGLVIERGGMLSHGAILAREFGIPCVVGVRNATAVIPDGAQITVDADKERVHVAH